MKCKVALGKDFLEIPIYAVVYWLEGCVVYIYIFMCMEDIHSVSKSKIKLLYCA